VRQRRRTKKIVYGFWISLRKKQAKGENEMSCDDVYGIFHEKEIIIPGRSTPKLQKGFHMNRAGERLLPERESAAKSERENFR
jgi:hypothetical protein